jgi:hypothetical protein
LGFLGGLNPYDAATGHRLARFVLGGPVSSAAAVVDGEVFVGEGTGARGGSPAEAEFQQSILPSHVNAFCLPSSPDCPTTACDDGDPCTYDFHRADGQCDSEPAPDGIPCGAMAEKKVCRAAQCVATD